MRSILFAVALAAPLSAVAATPIYSNPMTALRAQKQQVVLLTFVNASSQQRTVLVGDMRYQVRWGAPLRVVTPVGSVVRVYSDQNSKVNGQELMQVSANDADKSIVLK